MLTIGKRLYPQGGSLLVVVPKLWANAKRLRARDLVGIQVDEDLVITPARGEYRSRPRMSGSWTRVLDRLPSWVQRRYDLLRR